MQYLKKNALDVFFLKYLNNFRIFSHIQQKNIIIIFIIF